MNIESLDFSDTQIQKDKEVESMMQTERELRETDRKLGRKSRATHLEACGRTICETRPLNQNPKPLSSSSLQNRRACVRFSRN